MQNVLVGPLRGLPGDGSQFHCSQLDTETEVACKAWLATSLPHTKSITSIVSATVPGLGFLGGQNHLQWRPLCLPSVDPGWESNPCAQPSFQARVAREFLSRAVVG